MKVCPEIVRTLCAEFRPLSVDWGPPKSSFGQKSKHRSRFSWRNKLD